MLAVSLEIGSSGGKGIGMSETTTMGPCPEDRLGFAIFGADYVSDHGYTYEQYVAWINEGE
jgi:hypothetical protein